VWDVGGRYDGDQIQGLTSFIAGRPSRRSRLL
jgi:hypothetical protein